MRDVFIGGKLFLDANSTWRLCMSRFSIAIVMSFGFLMSSVSYADCSALINDAIAWANKHDALNQYYVGFTISTMKAPVKFVSYAGGSFVAGNGGLKADKVKTSFSDRTWCPNLPAGSFCIGYQPFNYQAQDEMSFTLTNNGNLKVVLNSWGNATYNIPLQCVNGFLYGTLVERNGNSFVTMNLNKYSVGIPR